MVKIAEISRTSTFAWSSDSLPLLATGTVAGVVDDSFSSQVVLEIWDAFSPIDKTKPIVEFPVDARFHAIAWSKPFDLYSKGLIVGAFENGLLEFWDANVLLKTKDLAKASVLKDDTTHTIDKSGFVKSLLFHPSKNHVLVTGGDKGQIFLWDLKNLSSKPTVLSASMTSMDGVSAVGISSVAWNQQVDHILALTCSDGYASVWDIRSKKEVLRLSHQVSAGQPKATFSCVAWHPTELTKLVTASDNNSCPFIMTWDLKHSGTPDAVLTSHTLGVLSLDWCGKDSELLISSGKDNSTILWNPITSEKLSVYPTTTKWAFQTKFAPQVPDIFATALFDGKIIIQSLQDTSPPVLDSANESSGDDNQFWNNISTTGSQQPTLVKSQAPKWLKTPVSVNFGFGSKLVSVSTNSEGKSVINISKFVSHSTSTEKLSRALNENDFKPFIEEKEEFVNDKDKQDWDLLKKLAASSTSKKLLDIQIKDEVSHEINSTKKEEEVAAEIALDEDSFFDNLGAAGIKKVEPSFVPSGDFSIFDSKKASPEIDSLVKLILNANIDGAVSLCLEQNLLVEALILALDASNDSKNAVRNAYFKKNASSSISRLLYSASNKNVADIVANADVKNWKQIASSISAYSTNEDDYKKKITQLGDRVLATKDRENALICFVAGDALDKISLVWLEELADAESDLLKNKASEISTPTDARFEALHNFVGKLSAYRSIAKNADKFLGPQFEKLSKVLLEYSSLLAGFGEFELAKKFLDLLPEDFAGLKLERERISKALGTKAEPQVQSRSSINGRIPSAVTPAFIRSPARSHANIRQPFVPSIPAAPPAPNGNYNRHVASFPPPPPPSSFGTGSAVPSNPTVPIANPYGAKPPVALSNPYAAKPQAANPYAPQSSNSLENAPSNAYKPAGVVPPTNSFSVAPPPFGASIAPASTGVISPPPQEAYKKDEGGWNDLPDTFKPKVAPRRANAVTSPPPQVDSPQPNLNVTKRTNSSTGPVLPPPPKGVTRTSSKQSVPSLTSSPSLGPVTTSRYAPPPGQSREVSSSMESPILNHSPALLPKNPYAKQQSPPPARNAYAQPTPSFGSSFPPATPVAAPPKNPYAPTANPQVTPTGILPPPPTAGAAPPPTGPPRASAPLVGPPRSTVPTSVPTPPPAAPPATFGPPLVQQSVASAPSQLTSPPFTPGDRSQIPAESLPIYEHFNRILEEIMPDIPEQYAKHGEAVVKRLNILFDLLNSSSLSPEVVGFLIQISDFLKAKNYKDALTLHVELTTKHTDEVSSWHAGVKHLIQMTEALL